MSQQMEIVAWVLALLMMDDNGDVPEGIMGHLSRALADPNRLNNDGRELLQRIVKYAKEGVPSDPV